LHKNNTLFYNAPNAKRPTEVGRYPVWWLASIAPAPPISPTHAMSLKRELLSAVHQLQTNCPPTM
jgi:hypothetical protein